MKTTAKRITVIGLGKMGVKIAELLRDNGNEVTVWNRTAARASEIKGLNFIENIDEAIAQSEVSILIVFDYAAINEIFRKIDDISVLKDKTFINLTTGSLQDAENLEHFIQQHGGKYLDGAIQVAPEQMGKPDTTILLSGTEQVFEEQESLIKILGENIKYLGAKISAASAMDLATLGWLYGSYAGLIHGAALIARTGLDLGNYRDIIAEITPGFTEFFKHELDVIHSGDYTISQSPLSISAAATERISTAMKDSGIDHTFHENISLMLKKAVQLGYEKEELAALVKIVLK
jgi:3-hydroxyisobutyrate dehydrogenase-like beta-hydroxyacid dehydrogenase